MSQGKFKNIIENYVEKKKMPRLSPRLRHIADKINPCNRLIDIGCDHGYLGIHMISQKKCSYAILTEINKKPYDETKKLISELALTGKIEILHCDGLGEITLRETDTLVIAGMGAYEIRSILMQAELPENIRMCLQATWNREVLRHYLAQEGYEIEETLVLDKGKVYASFFPRQVRKKRRLSLLEASIGEAFLENGVSFQYYMKAEPRLLKEWFDYLLRIYSKKKLREPKYSEVCHYLIRLCDMLALAL